jgi:mannose-6-phosphate isomerase-like protein (cupin superfamily)
MANPSPSHVREDELFYDLSGEITFTNHAGPAPKHITARAGDSISLPHNQPHSFKNIGTTLAEVLTEVFPGGNFDAYIEEVADPMQPGTNRLPDAPPTPEQIGRVLENGPAFGIAFHL